MYTNKYIHRSTQPFGRYTAAIDRVGDILLQIVHSIYMIIPWTILFLVILRHNLLLSASYRHFDDSDDEDDGDPGNSGDTSGIGKEIRRQPIVINVEEHFRRKQQQQQQQVATINIASLGSGTAHSFSSSSSSSAAAAAAAATTIAESDRPSAAQIDKHIERCNTYIALVDRLIEQTARLCDQSVVLSERCLECQSQRGVAHGGGAARGVIGLNEEDHRDYGLNDVNGSGYGNGIDELELDVGSGMDLESLRTEYDEQDNDDDNDYEGEDDSESSSEDGNQDTNGEDDSDGESADESEHDFESGDDSEGEEKNDEEDAEYQQQEEEAAEYDYEEEELEHYHCHHNNPIYQSGQTMVYYVPFLTTTSPPEAFVSTRDIHIQPGPVNYVDEEEDEEEEEEEVVEEAQPTILAAGAGLSYNSALVQRSSLELVLDRNNLAEYNDVSSEEDSNDNGDDNGDDNDENGDGDADSGEDSPEDESEVDQGPPVYPDSYERWRRDGTDYGHRYNYRYRYRNRGGHGRENDNWPGQEERHVRYGAHGGIDYGNEYFELDLDGETLVDEYEWEDYDAESWAQAHAEIEAQAQVEENEGRQEDRQEDHQEDEQDGHQEGEGEQVEEAWYESLDLADLSSVPLLSDLSRLI